MFDKSIVIEKSTLGINMHGDRAGDYIYYYERNDIMCAWFNTDPVYAVLWILAIPSSVILILQTILLLFGIGAGADSDLDSDTSGLGDADVGDVADDADGEMGGGMEDSGLRLFTVRGMVAFFAVGSWSGITAISLGAHPLLAILIALVMGALALLFVAYFIKWTLRLQHDGTMKPSEALGKECEVYMTIGANRSSRGKVNIILGQQLVEMDAVTDSETPLKYGERVTVTQVLGDNTLVVSPNR